MEGDSNFRKVFLITMIIALSISALIGILIIIFGTLGEIEGKILLTTLTIGGFSLTGLVSAALYEKGRARWLAITGMIVSVIGFLLAVIAIWSWADFNMDYLKAIIISIIASVSIAHISILLFIKSNKTIVNTLLSITILFISAVAITLSVLVLNELSFFSEIWLRTLGVFAIIDVLGTIVTPITHAIVKPRQSVESN